VLSDGADSPGRFENLKFAVSTARCVETPSG